LSLRHITHRTPEDNVTPKGKIQQILNPPTPKMLPFQQRIMRKEESCNGQESEKKKTHPMALLIHAYLMT
jgi:hypothetical protein